MEAASAVDRPLTVLETVRCLECSEVYSKPSAGGTTQKNPGCPICGYVGWIPVTAADVRARSAAGLRPLRRARSR